MSRNLENENPETKKSGKVKSGKEKIRKKINPEKKKSGKEKFGKEIKHLDTFFSLSVSIDRGQRHSYPYVLSPVFMLSLITMCCSLPWFFCVHYAISQAQSRRAKEDGAEDIGDAETNRQFGHSLLQRRHRSRRASRWTLTTGGFKEINFLSDCLSYPHSFYLLCLL